MHLRRLEVRKRVRGVPGQLPKEAPDAGEVDLLDLGGEPRPPLAVEVFEGVGQLILPGVGEAFAEGRHRRAATARARP